MTNEQDYNGWTNRETWATMLHINNDQGLQETALDYAREAMTDDSQADDLNAYYLAEALENWFDAMAGDFTELSAGAYYMFRDIGSLYRVNWREIAEALLETAKEEAVA